MPSQNPAHSTCALGLSLSTQTTLPTRLQVIRKQVEGQKRTTPLSEEAQLYTVIPNNSNPTVFVVLPDEIGTGVGSNQHLRAKVVNVVAH